MEPQIVTAAIIIKDGTALVVRRAPSEKLAGKWEFPGGKVEAGETAEACLERELYEELNIRGTTGQHLCDSRYDYGSGAILLKAYLYNWTSGKMKLTVHDQLKWLHPNELLSVDLAPADIAVAQSVKEYMGHV